jgi:hypothetical protein
MESRRVGAARVFGAFKRVARRLGEAQRVDVVPHLLGDGI